MTLTADGPDTSTTPSSGSPQIETFDPRTGQLIGTVADMGADEVAAAVARARVAFAGLGRARVR